MEMRWGLVPDMAGYPLWRGNVRDDLLRRLVFTNEEFSGAEAQVFGFATETSEVPLERAMALAETIAQKNPDAIRAAKRLSNMLAHASDEAILLAESAEQEQILGRPNQVEAVMAQMEKRAPSFS
jgi:enoyl-CoA hydratase/carnithine racemase